MMVRRRLWPVAMVFLPVLGLLPGCFSARHGGATGYNPVLLRAGDHGELL